MGFWSGIKHALNSTLGTSSFSPLDKIVNKESTSIRSAVNNTRDSLTRSISGVDTNVKSLRGGGYKHSLLTVHLPFLKV